MAHFIGENKPWMRGPPSGGDSSSGSGSGYSSTDKRSGPNDRLSSHWWNVWQRHYGYSNQSSSQNDTRSASNTNAGATSFGVSPNVTQLVQQIGNAQTEHKGPTSWSNDGGENRRRTVTFEDQPTIHQGSPVQTPDASEEGEELFVPIRSINVQGGPQSLTPPTPKFNEEPDNRTHYEQYLDGDVPDFIMTPEGPVPEKKYFKTGLHTYIIQEYHSTGEPVTNPINYVVSQYAPPPSDLPSPNGLEAFYEEADSFYPDATWDPTKSAPPPGSMGEASNLRLINYSNQWDNEPQNDTIFVPPVTSAAPHVKPIFPWEQKPRAVTRVFAGEAPEPIYESEHSETESEEDEETEDEVDDAPPPPPQYQERPFGRYQLENKWDNDPHIRNYVASFQKRTNLGPGTSRVAPVDGLPSLPVTPIPVQRMTFQAEPEGASPEENQEQPWVHTQLYCRST